MNIVKRYFFPKYPDLYKKAITNPENESSPFYGFVGNTFAVERLARSAYIALDNENHICRSNFSFLGPSSTGKTTLAKKFANVLKIPFVEIHPISVQSLNDLVGKIDDSLKEYKYNNGTMELIASKNTIHVPPMVVFIDEVHSLQRKIIQGLLKATEPNDRTLITEVGWKLNFNDVCWTIATTERGKLPEPFDTRFTKINLSLYNKNEISKIVRHNYPTLDKQACELVAHYSGRVPREALAFAREMLEEKLYSNAANWQSISRRVAQQRGIDEHGMTFQRLEILKSLKQKPLSINRLCFIAECQLEELRKYILPPLLETPSLIGVTSRGYELTALGIQELVKRGL